MPVIEALNRLPRIAHFFIVLALFGAAFLLGPWGWVPLALITVFVAWLLFLTWPHLTPPERALRVAALVICVVMTFVRAFPRS